MWSLILVWLAGGFATLGCLDAVSRFEGTKINTDIYISKFIQSWYAFGMMIFILLTEIGKKIDEISEKNESK